MAVRVGGENGIGVTGAGETAADQGKDIIRRNLQLLGVDLNNFINEQIITKAKDSASVDRFLEQLQRLTPIWADIISKATTQSSVKISNGSDLELFVQRNFGSAWYQQYLQIFNDSFAVGETDRVFKLLASRIKILREQRAEKAQQTVVQIATQQQAEMERQSAMHMPLPEMPADFVTQKESDLIIQPPDESGEVSVDEANLGSDDSSEEYGQDLEPEAVYHEATIEPTVSLREVTDATLDVLRQRIASAERMAGGVRKRLINRVKGHTETHQAEEIGRFSLLPNEAGKYKKQIESFLAGKSFLLVERAVEAVMEGDADEEDGLNLSREILFVPGSQLAKDTYSADGAGFVRNFTVTIDPKTDSREYQLGRNEDTLRFLPIDKENSELFANEYRDLKDNLHLYTIYARGLRSATPESTQAQVLLAGINDYKEALLPIGQRLDLVEEAQWQDAVDYFQKTLDLGSRRGGVGFGYSAELRAQVEFMAEELGSLQEVVTSSLAAHKYAVTDKFLNQLNKWEIPLSAQDQDLLNQHDSLIVRLTELNTGNWKRGRRDLSADLNMVINLSQQVQSLYQTIDARLGEAKHNYYDLRIGSGARERVPFYLQALSLAEEDDEAGDLTETLIALDKKFYDLYQDFGEMLREYGIEPAQLEDRTDVDSAFDWLTDWLERAVSYNAAPNPEEARDAVGRRELAEATANYDAIMVELDEALANLESWQADRVRQLLEDNFDELYVLVKEISDEREDRNGVSEVQKVRQTAEILNNILDQHLQYISEQAKNELNG